jgi:hypothetical protein
MSQAYSDPSREDEETSLPDVEVWCDGIFESECCDTDHHAGYVLATDGQECQSCGRKGVWRETDRKGWFYWYCLPGCLPDSDAFGPFATEAEALADAQEGNE